MVISSTLRNGIMPASFHTTGSFRVLTSLHQSHKVGLIVQEMGRLFFNGRRHDYLGFVGIYEFLLFPMRFVENNKGALLDIVGKDVLVCSLGINIHFKTIARVLLLNKIERYFDILSYLNCGDIKY